MPDSAMPEAILPQSMVSATGMTHERDRMDMGGSMNNDELDRILSKQDEIKPSSGFALSVMEAVREDAAVPPPIPFPWKRALPVLLVAALTLIVVVVTGTAAIVQFSRGDMPSQVASSLWDLLPAYARGSAGAGLAWTAVALLASFVCVKLSMNLASGRT